MKESLFLFLWVQLIKIKEFNYVLIQLLNIYLLLPKKLIMDLLHKKIKIIKKYKLKYNSKLIKKNHLLVMYLNYSNLDLDN